MANSIPGQIIGELGEIGKKVGGEVAKIPKDIAGKAMESLGSGGSNKMGANMTVTPSSEGKTSDSMWDKIGLEKDKKIKRSIARKALEDLVSKSTQKREPSIWERLQMEQEQKKAQMAQQKGATPLTMPTSKRARGDLYGAKAKKTATENKNVRQD